MPGSHARTIQVQQSTLYFAQDQDMTSGSYLNQIIA